MACHHWISVCAQALPLPPQVIATAAAAPIKHLREIIELASVFRGVLE